MKWKLFFALLVNILLADVALSISFTEEYKCKFINQGRRAPRPDSIRLFYSPFSNSKIEWSRPYYNEAFSAENIYIHNDSFINKILVEFEQQAVRAFKVAANYPLSIYFMRFIVLQDSIQNKEIVSGVWILTHKESLFSEEVIISKENLNCKVI